MQTLILKPEDVEVQLVALKQFTCLKPFEALGLLALLRMARRVTSDEVGQIAELEWILPLA